MIAYEPCICQNEDGVTTAPTVEGWCSECLTPHGYVGPGRPVSGDVVDLLQSIGHQVADHLCEIMFDPLAEPEDDCVLCETGLTSGLWARFGVDDPFVPDGAPA